MLLYGPWYWLSSCFLHAVHCHPSPDQGLNSAAFAAVRKVCLHGRQDAAIWIGIQEERDHTILLSCSVEC